MSNIIITLVLFMSLQGQMIHGGQIEDTQCLIDRYSGGGPRNEITLHTSNIEDALQNQDECRFEPYTPIDPHSVDLAPIQGITFLPLSCQSSPPTRRRLQTTHFCDIPSVTTSLL